MAIIKKLKAGPYTFEKNGRIERVADQHTLGTDVYWSPHVRRWMFVDLDFNTVRTTDRIAAVTICSGQDSDAGLNQASLAYDVDSCIWIVDADWLEDVDAGYVKIIFTE